MSIFDDSRAAWGAARNTNPRPVAASARLGISWHYDGGAALNLANRPHSACLTRVKADQRFHQSPARGWADIGYNLLVCQHGRVIEGRGVDLQGAHSPGVNVQHYGVQFMVGGSEAPTAAAYARAARLARDLAAHSGRTLRQWGHRDDPSASTECPGAGIEAWVKRQGSASPTLSKPSNPAPAPVPEEDIMASIADLDAAIAKRLPDIAKAVIFADIIDAPRANLAADPDNKEWTLRSYLYYTYASLQDARAEIAGLTAAVRALAESHGASGDAVVEAVRGEVAKAMQGLEVTLTTKPDPGA